MAKKQSRELSRNPAPIVELRRVSKQYSGEKRLALADIDLAVNPGEFLAILGPSGAGKSTLLHILGLLDRPTEGQVFAMGVSANELQEDARAKLRSCFLGFVFQFHFLLPDLTVWENILLPLLISTDDRVEGLSIPASDSSTYLGDFGVSTSRQPRRNENNQDSWAEKVEKILAAIGLLDKADSLPEELSGGEKQRVAVARALVGEPPLVLADEPTGNLDTANAKLVWDLLVKANIQQGIAVVAITHNEELAMGAERTLKIVDGRIVDGRE